MKSIARFAAAGVALAVAATLTACTAATATPAHAPHPTIYTFTSDVNGFDTHTEFLDTGKSVVAFDAQFTPGYAEKAMAFLRTKTNHPVKYVVVTHPNPDKFQGIPTFKAAGAISIASTATAEAMPRVWTYKKNFFVNVAKTFTNDNYPALPAIDRTFNRRSKLVIDGVRIDLRVLDHPGISSTQTIATVPALKSVIVGDLVHHGAHAWLEGGIIDGKPAPALDGWKQDLDQIKDHIPGTWTVYGGRGTTTTVYEAVTQQKAYLTAADRDVSALIAPLTPAQRTAALADPSALVVQLVDKLTSQFPAHELPYMISYGSYGLISQHLAQ
ncbi:MBL fold metallo-hydrolase [Streptomyces sp. NPDC007355]|uniref:MBL fold metallo-hydrolase n=1 Tax=Streptomyces sp. NPDC007355 TaxID=3364778 RepID=UPI0036756C70